MDNIAKVEFNYCTQECNCGCMGFWYIKDGIATYYDMMTKFNRYGD